MEEFFTYLFINYFKKKIKNEGVMSVIQIQTADINSLLQGDLIQQFESSFTLGELQKNIKDKVTALASNTENAKVWVKAKQLAQTDQTFALFLNLYKYFLKIDYEETQLLQECYVGYLISKNSNL